MKRKYTSKRMLGILLTICMVVSLLPVMSMTAFAGGGDTIINDINITVSEELLNPKQGITHVEFESDFKNDWKVTSTECFIDKSILNSSLVVKAPDEHLYVISNDNNPSGYNKDDYIDESKGQYYMMLFVSAKTGYDFDDTKLDEINILVNENKLPGAYIFDYNKSFRYVKVFLPLTINTDTVEITSVAVTNLPTPMEGLSCEVDRDALTLTTVPADAASIYVNGAYWYDETDKKSVSATDVFTVGHKYHIVLIIEPKEGYTFEYNGDYPGFFEPYTGKATINGEDVNEADKAYSGLDWLRLRGKTIIMTEDGAAMITEIKSADASDISLPVEGETPDYDVTLPADANYRLVTKEEIAAIASEELLNAYRNGVVWFEVTEESEYGVPISPETTFVAGKEYRVGVVLAPKEGYIFAESATVTFNGKPELYSEEGSYVSSSIFALMSVPLKAPHTHTGTLVPAVDPTCTEEGNTAYYTCDCGKWFEDEACTTEILDHDSVVLPALGHDYQDAWLKDENGHWHQCTRCGEKTDAAAHTFGEWKETTPPTETEKGEKQHECTVCGYIETAEIDPIGSTDPEPVNPTPISDTGDTTDMTLLVTMLMASLGGLCAVGYRKKKTEK